MFFHECFFNEILGEWPYYDEDGFMDEDDGGMSPDSDFEYEDSFSRKRKSGAGTGGGGGRKGGRSSNSKGVSYTFKIMYYSIEKQRKFEMTTKVGK